MEDIVRKSATSKRLASRVRNAPGVGQPSHCGVLSGAVVLALLELLVGARRVVPDSRHH